MTVKEFLTISSIATEPEVIRTKLDELKKPYQLGQYKTPDTLNDINMGELMQLQSIATEHDILFVPCTVLMGLSKTLYIPTSSYRCTGIRTMGGQRS